MMSSSRLTALIGWVGPHTHWSIGGFWAVTCWLCVAHDKRLLRVRWAVGLRNALSQGEISLPCWMSDMLELGNCCGRQFCIIPFITIWTGSLKQFASIIFHITYLCWFTGIHPRFHVTGRCVSMPRRLRYIFKAARARLACLIFAVMQTCDTPNFLSLGLLLLKLLISQTSCFLNWRWRLMEVKTLTL